MFDPISFWMKGSVIWVRILQQQQEAYLRMLAAFAQGLPRESSAELAREAEAMKATLKRSNASKRPAPRRSADGDKAQRVSA